MEIIMKIKMLRDIEASCNISGNATRIYKNAEIVDCTEPWQVELANNFVNGNLAMEVKVDAPTETKAKKKVTKKKATKAKG